MQKNKDGKMVFVWSAALIIFLLQYAWQFMAIPKVVQRSTVGIVQQSGLLKVVNFVMVDGILIAKMRRGLSHSDQPVAVVIVKNEDKDIHDEPIQIARMQRPIVVSEYGEQY
jgi:hypothetical protein